MSEKIKIVALIGQLGRGGSERQLFLTMTHLNPDQFERHVVVFNPSRHAVFDENLQTVGVTVWSVPQGCRTISQRMRFLAHLLCKIKADIVHSWTNHDNPYAAFAGAVSRVPVRWGSVRISLADPGFQSLPRIFRWLSLRSVQKLVVNSQPLVMELVQSGVPQQRIIKLSNAIQTNSEEIFPTDLSEFGIDQNSQVVGVVANIRHRKNQMLFVEALAQVHYHLPKAYGVLVGQELPDEKEYALTVRRRMDELKISDRITWLGFRDDIPNLLHRFDVFCLVSRQEGTPNALLEAMAAGRPVVATRVGGIPDLIDHGKNGLLVDSEDVTSLAQAVTYLLNNPDYARQLGENGRRLVAQNYSCETIAGQLGQMYAQAMLKI